MTLPICPKCGERSDTPHGDNYHAFYCHSCRMAFEPDDDGDGGPTRPDRAAEIKEERELRRQERLQGRRAKGR